MENGQHLLNCLVYINLNMVRAGAVSHPQEWSWCSHRELVGRRQRYRILNRDRLLESLGLEDEKALTVRYEEALSRRMEARQMAREAHWSESLAVGSQPFVLRACQSHTSRQHFDFCEVTGDEGPLWSVRESPCSYTTVSAPKNAF